LTDLQSNTVCVVGPSRRQNELMTSYLENKMEAKCLAGNAGYCIPPKDNREEPDKRLILWDCQGKGKQNFLDEFDSNGNEELSQDLAAFFNVSPNLGIEEEAVDRGARGLFYESDSLDHLPKGIRAIFKGELWLSRQVMSKCVLQKRLFVAPRSKKVSDILSKREVEILSLLTVGATNQEIADNLSISPCTVKSHLYKIFSKIGVPNRLQAVLWAGKNM